MQASSLITMHRIHHQLHLPSPSPPKRLNKSYNKNSQNHKNNNQAKRVMEQEYLQVLPLKRLQVKKD